MINNAHFDRQKVVTYDLICTHICILSIRQQIHWNQSTSWP